MNILMILANPFTHDHRVYNEAKSLVKAGHEVTVLAWDKTGKHPKNEVKDGITVIRCYNSKFMDISPYDIFRLHFWWRKGYKDALEFFKKNKFDIVHCHDLSSLPIGVKLKKKLDIPLIYDAHEIWGYMVEKDLPKTWANYYLWKEKHLLKYVDEVITVSKPFKKYFSTITDKAITIIMNCKSLQRMHYESPNTEKMTLLYIGIFAPSRFSSELVDIAEGLLDVHYIVAGAGHDKVYVNAR